LKILPLLLFGYRIRNHDPPQPDQVYIPELIYDDSDSQIPAFDYWSWGLTYRMYFKNWLMWLAELLV